MPYLAKNYLKRVDVSPTNLVNNLIILLAFMAMSFGSVSKSMAQEFEVTEPPVFQELSCANLKGEFSSLEASWQGNLSSLGTYLSEFEVEVRSKIVSLELKVPDEDDVYNVEDFVFAMEDAVDAINEVMVEQLLSRIFQMGELSSDCLAQTQMPETVSKWSKKGTLIPQAFTNFVNSSGRALASITGLLVQAEEASWAGKLSFFVERMIERQEAGQSLSADDLKPIYVVLEQLRTTQEIYKDFEILLTDEFSALNSGLSKE